eukprot:261352-Chlamydomonas_euryale.AAC.1
MDMRKDGGAAHAAWWGMCILACMKNIGAHLSVVMPSTQWCVRPHCGGVASVAVPLRAAVRTSWPAQQRLRADHHADRAFFLVAARCRDAGGAAVIAGVCAAGGGGLQRERRGAGGASRRCARGTHSVRALPAPRSDAGDEAGVG